MSEPQPFDDLHCEYAWVSGANHHACAFLGRRWRDAYGTTLSDSDYFAITTYTDEEGEGRLRWWGPWPNIWIALWFDIRSGRVYACDVDQGSVHIWEDIAYQKQPATTHPIGFTPEGMWGLNRSHLYIYGIGHDASGAQEPRLGRFTRKKTFPMPSPGFYITRMHGPSPDFFYAVGHGGSIARWDGEAWTTSTSPVGSVVSDVFVAEPDEVYITTLNGVLLQGSVEAGWRVLAETIDGRLPLLCVVKYKGSLFVGDGVSGLFRYDPETGTLVLFKEKVRASQFESRGDELLIATPNAVAYTADGENFRGTAIDSLCTHTATIDIAE